jgi:hypothetical protein
MCSKFLGFYCNVNIESPLQHMARLGVVVVRGIMLFQETNRAKHCDAYFSSYLHGILQI